MQRAATRPPVASPDLEEIPVFSVVIAYEDYTTGRQAKRACDLLVANLNHKWEVSRQMWKFGVLSLPELRQMAAEDAAMANLIIVSSRGDRGLSVEVKAWIEMWLGYEGEAVALVALFNCPLEQAEHAQATQAYLAGAAKRGHLEFFTWPQAGPGRESLVLDRHAETIGGPLLLPAWLATQEGSFIRHAINL
jgi:hypothetical protein